MNDLKLYVKTEQLLYKVYPMLVNYPKAEKFALCEHIKNNFFDALKYISLANNVKSRRMVYAQEADGHIQVLKILIKLSKERKYISVGAFKAIDLELTEIGKMLSAYIRAIKR